LEVRNALRLGIFRRVLTNPQAAAAATAIETDLRMGRLVRTQVDWATTFRIARRLSTQHAAQTGTRSLDILHVASAKSLRVRRLASFDSRQMSLAVTAGLTDVFELPC
jgi:hypothetical protein